MIAANHRVQDRTMDGRITDKKIHTRVTLLNQEMKIHSNLIFNYAE